MQRQEEEETEEEEQEEEAEEGEGEETHAMRLICEAIAPGDWPLGDKFRWAGPRCRRGRFGVRYWWLWARAEARAALLRTPGPSATVIPCVNGA